jgi:hypothetical protein
VEGWVTPVLVIGAFSMEPYVVQPDAINKTNGSKNVVFNILIG